MVELISCLTLYLLVAGAVFTIDALAPFSCVKNLPLMWRANCHLTLAILWLPLLFAALFCYVFEEIL